jgi:DNA (cytosine-5)-methyltransferase 3A
MSEGKEKINVLSLFDGISCGQIALERAGIKVETYFASEIDKYAISVTQNNYPNTIQLGSVLDVESADLPKIDLLIGGSPCQGFSFAGKQLNFDDPRSKLFFEFVRLKNECSPTYFLLENNRMKKEYQDIISSYLGVEPIKINSSLVSGQNRERLYWTNIPNVIQPEDKKIMLSDIIGDYDGIWVYPRGYNKGGVQSYKGKSPTITTSSWEHNFFIYKNGNKEPFTVDICEKLQTLPVGYTNILSKSKAIKHIGNSWTVDVISFIFSFLRGENFLNSFSHESSIEAQK